MKMAVFWDVTPYSLVEVYRHFRGAYCLHHQGPENINFQGRARSKLIVEK
jgi:hypothetical protein